MADRLTQLQDAIDNQLTLMYAAVNYIRSRHPYGDIPGQPSQAPDPAPLSAVAQSLPNGDGSQPNGPVTGAKPMALDQQQGSKSSTPPPEQLDTFNASLHELARDLVLQEQQIEILINSLPGLGSSEASQQKKMRELEAELRTVEEVRRKAEEEKEVMVNKLGDILTRTQRVP
ncbi:RNA polymerase II mediator complex subunit [Recurvomyces mirabilis]|nr:RNA polymerase II mediator complex subunit [Recurvomyces mirabilis]